MEYPKKFEIHVRLKDGEDLFLRPIRPTDINLAKEFFKKLSDMTRQLSFFTRVKDVQDERILEFITVDYKRSMVVVALNKGEIVGAIRYGWDNEDETLELKETVRDDWHGKGVGTALFKHIIEIAKDNGYNTAKAQILSENTKAINLFQKGGFDINFKWKGNYVVLTFDISEVNDISHG